MMGWLLPVVSTAAACCGESDGALVLFVEAARLIGKYISPSARARTRAVAELIRLILELII